MHTGRMLCFLVGIESDCWHTSSSLVAEKEHIFFLPVCESWIISLTAKAFVGAVAHDNLLSVLFCCAAWVDAQQHQMKLKQNAHWSKLLRFADRSGFVSVCS